MFRKIFPRKNKSRKKDTKSADPPVPPRPQSQLATRSSEPAPPTLRWRSSDSKQVDSIIIPSSQSDLGATGGATPEGPFASDNHHPVPNIHYHPPVPNVDGNKPVKLSSYVVDPTAAYENKPDWKSTVYASAGLAIDVLKESSDAFTPLKSVVGGLSAILKYYDV